MGKRSSFERKPRDFYPTPMEAVVPLLPHLHQRTFFDEPCCGNGDLIRHIEMHGHRCVGSSDIESNPCYGAAVDALSLGRCQSQMFITNPPWTRSILHPMIEHLAGLAPTWLLIDADWAHTKQATPFLAYCHKVVAIGRVKWIPGSSMTGKDNCCWYLFDRRGRWHGTHFFGRA
jgi:hypothetical protein